MKNWTWFGKWDGAWLAHNCSADWPADFGLLLLEQIAGRLERSMTTTT